MTELVIGEPVVQHGGMLVSMGLPSALVSYALDARIGDVN